MCRLSKKKKRPVIKALILVFAVCLAAASVLYIFTRDKLPALVINNLFAQEDPPLVDIPSDYIASTGSRPPIHAKQPTVLQETTPADRDYLDNTVFIGDSRVEGMRLNGSIQQKNAYAQTGMSHVGAMTTACVDLGTGRLLTIPQAVAIRKPQRMVVAFGINGIVWMGEESFIQGYEELIDTLMGKSPNSIVIIQSILPVSSWKEQSDPRMSNQKIDRYNELLLDLAERKGIYYLNAAEKMKNSRNALDSRYDSGDGLHFNAAAGDLIVDYLLSHSV